MFIKLDIKDLATHCGFCYIRQEQYLPQQTEEQCLKAVIMPEWLHSNNCKNNCRFANQLCVWQSYIKIRAQAKEYVTIVKSCKFRNNTTGLLSYICISKYFRNRRSKQLMHHIAVTYSSGSVLWARCSLLSSSDALTPHATRSFLIGTHIRHIWEVLAGSGDHTWEHQGLNKLHTNRHSECFGRKNAVWFHLQGIYLVCPQTALGTELAYSNWSPSGDLLQNCILLL